jgi:hypothetical protein
MGISKTRSSATCVAHRRHRQEARRSGAPVRDAIKLRVEEISS